MGERPQVVVVSCEVGGGVGGGKGGADVGGVGARTSGRARGVVGSGRWWGRRVSGKVVLMRDVLLT